MNKRTRSKKAYRTYRRRVARTRMKREGVVYPMHTRLGN